MPEWQALETSGPLGPPGRFQEAVWDLSGLWGDGSAAEPELTGMSRSAGACLWLLWTSPWGLTRVRRVPSWPLEQGIWPIRATLPVCHLCCDSQPVLLGCGPVLKVGGGGFAPSPDSLFLFPSSTFKDPCDYVRPSSIIPGNPSVWCSAD